MQSHGYLSTQEEYFSPSVIWVWFHNFHFLCITRSVKCDRNSKICKLAKLSLFIKVPCKKKNPLILHLYYFIWTFMNRNLKNYRHMWREHCPIFQNTKFRDKKSFEFGTKNGLFWYFCAVILKYLKSALSNS